mmetsp:Transcript_8215/g.4353  ORF Transcript_8215/g.4353 Transcript_8215/m.4353 type:complete len:193 (+) Transcript_8215:831-1409(+)
MIKELIKGNRSFRRFDESQRVDKETLKWLVNLARLSGSAANIQPLKYIISSNQNTNSMIFSCLSWAVYLKDWHGPEDGQRPAAYIVILQDRTLSKDDWCYYDCGIASQSILLGAREKGLGGCMVGSINKKKLSKALKIDPHFKILLVIAIGVPAEKVVIETVNTNNNIRYYRCSNDIHHVPKRKLEDIIIEC